LILKGSQGGALPDPAGRAAGQRRAKNDGGILKIFEF